jgi:hypothetical protein
MAMLLKSDTGAYVSEAVAMGQQRVLRVFNEFLRTIWEKTQTRGASSASTTIGRFKR